MAERAPGASGNSPIYPLQGIDPSRSADEAGRRCCVAKTLKATLCVPSVSALGFRFPADSPLHEAITS